MLAGSIPKKISVRIQIKYQQNCSDDPRNLREQYLKRVWRSSLEDFNEYINRGIDKEPSYKLGGWVPEPFQFPQTEGRHQAGWSIYQDVSKWECNVHFWWGDQDKPLSP